MPPHALRLSPVHAPADTPQVLEAVDAASVAWHWETADPGYGEAAVRAALQALQAAGARSVLVGWPEPSDLAARAAALVALEAARRQGSPMSLVLHGPWPGSVRPLGAPPGEAGMPRPLHAEDLDDILPAIWEALGEGLQRSPARRGAAVTVIVRSMDRPSLRQSLDSLRWQTHPPRQVVIVNAAGSVHRALPGAWADLPVQVVADPAGRPLPRPLAAQAGLQAALGGSSEGVLFLDDDDLLLPDHLAKLAEALQGHPEAAAVFSDVDLGRPGDRGWLSEHRFEADFDPLRLHFENYLPLHAVLFRRGLAERGARFDEELPIFEDWDFWLQCTALGPFVRVPGISARYTQASAGNSQVFDDSPQARAARHTLFRKWLQRLDPTQYGQLMQRLQQTYRAERQQLAQLQDVRQAVQSLDSRLAARERELADANVEVQGLRSIVTEREREIADAEAEIQSLRALVAERERELQSLSALLNAREREIADAGAEIRSLHALVAEREREIADAKAHAANLHAILAARDAEILGLKGELQTTQSALRDAQHLIQNEEPLSALRRTLRNKFHGHR